MPPDVDTYRSVALPPGQYYVVIDNSPYVGQAAPPASNPLFEPVARVSYLVSMEMLLDSPRARAFGLLGIAASPPWRIDTPSEPPNQTMTREC